jgi:nucleoside-diphosphate kinase
MSSGPVVAMVLEGEDAIQRTRKIMGATNPKEADPGTIRADYAEEVEQNIVHGSDGPETAAFEMSFFFSQLEMQ